MIYECEKPGPKNRARFARDQFKQMCPEIALAVFFTLAVRGNLTQAENEEKFERLWTNRVNLEIASL